MLTDLPDDGLHTPEIARHSLKKIEIHDYYVALFSAAMKDAWPQRAYLGLYSGAGRARVRGTGQIVETTPMGAIRSVPPFTKYIFVDQDPNCIQALDARIRAVAPDADVSLIQADVRLAVPEIRRAMPTYGPGSGLLSFCFIDPFSAALDFEVIRSLARGYRMDFLVLLMLGVDVRQNLRRYLDDPDDTRIAALIDRPGWREEWRALERPRAHFLRFILERFDDAMVRLGYRSASPDEAHAIRVAGKGVFLYSLVFYSRSPLGQKFWKAARRGTTEQLRFLDP